MSLFKIWAERATASPPPAVFLFGEWPSRGLALLHLLVTNAVDTFALLRAWQSHLEAQGRLSSSTRRSYLRTLIAFLTDVPVTLESLSEAQLEEHLRTLIPRPASRNLLLLSLASFYRWASPRHGLTDPTLDIAYSRQRRPRAEALSKAELEAIFTAAGEGDPRARPALEFIYGTCSRLHQAVAVTAADLDLTERSVHFSEVKNDAPYDAYLAPRAYAAALALLDLAEYQPKHATRQPTLIGVREQTVRNWLHEAATVAGVDRRVYPHLLRKTALTVLANDPSVSVAVLTAIANWRDATPMPHYVLAKNRDTRDAYAKL